MAIYKEDIVSIELENGVIHRSFLNHSIGSGDAAANRFGIRVFRNGSEVDLSGVSCQAYFQNAEGTNIALTSYGTVSGNVAYVTLPQACYNVEGQFCLAIKLVGGGVTGTMRIIDGMVCNTGTTGAVAPTSSVPTYQEILSTYAAMVSATSAANLAIAEPFDASENYPAGKNVINDGALYVLPNGHTAGTTWANTTKVASNLGDQVTDLKSALTKKLTLQFSTYEGKYIKSTGALATDNATHTSNLIPVSGGQTISFSNLPKENGFYCFGFYNSDTPSAASNTGVYVYGDSTASDSTVVVPAGSKYMLYSYPSNKTAGDLYVGNTSFMEGVGQIADDVESVTDVVESVIMNQIAFTYTNYDGKYIKNDGGLATDNATHTSDLVPVFPGQILYFKDVPITASFYCFGFYSNDTPSGTSSTGKYAYDSSHASDISITVPNGSAYMVYSYPSGGTAGKVFIGNAKLIDGIVPGQTTFFERKNLFNIYAHNLIGRYYDATNTLKTAAAYGQSDLIPVVVGDVYTSTETGFNVNYYASDGTFVSAVSSTTYNTNKKVTIPSGVAYARFMFTVAQIDNFEVWSLSEDYYSLKPEFMPYEDNTDTDNPWDGMNGVAFGTSITYRAQTTGGYLQFLPTLSGITFDNQGVGSSAIFNPSNPSLDMLKVIKEYTGYANKDVVIIEGFVNDWYGQKTLGTYTDSTEESACGCLRSAINYVYSQNAKVTMFVIFDHYGRNYNSVDESSTAVRGGKTQYEYYEEMAKVCASLGIKTIKLYEMAEFSQLTPQYFLDDIHPNGLGAEHEANKIWSVMKTYAPNINT